MAAFAKSWRGRRYRAALCSWRHERALGSYMRLPSPTRWQPADRWPAMTSGKATRLN
jgi:hypothetical protein